MEKRMIAPIILFVLAAGSFAFGIWQYYYAQRVQATSDARITHIMTVLDQSGLLAKRMNTKIVRLSASIFEGYPTAPTMFGFDFSGSFASQQVSDQCINDGQRSVCRSLKSQHADAAVYANVCGTCNP